MISYSGVLHGAWCGGAVSELVEEEGSCGVGFGSCGLCCLVSWVDDRVVVEDFGKKWCLLRRGDGFAETKEGS